MRPLPPSPGYSDLVGRELEEIGLQDYVARIASSSPGSRVSVVAQVSFISVLMLRGNEAVLSIGSCTEGSQPGFVEYNYTTAQNAVRITSYQCSTSSAVEEWLSDFMEGLAGRLANYGITLARDWERLPVMPELPWGWVDW